MLLPTYLYVPYVLNTRHDTTRIHVKGIIGYDHDERPGESVYEKKIYKHFKREFVTITKFHFRMKKNQGLQTL